MKYNRILLKLSGESLQGAQGYGLSTDVLHSYAAQIRQAVEAGVQVAVVIGGGNIFRGLQGAGRGFDRVKGDQMGMLATIINSLALQSALENDGVRARVLTSIQMCIRDRYGGHRAVVVHHDAVQNVRRRLAGADVVQLLFEMVDSTLHAAFDVGHNRLCIGHIPVSYTHLRNSSAFQGVRSLSDGARELCISG